MIRPYTYQKQVGTENHEDKPAACTILFNSKIREAKFDGSCLQSQLPGKQRLGELQFEAKS
jgi:hypothetical protein